MLHFEVVVLLFPSLIFSWYRRIVGSVKCGLHCRKCIYLSFQIRSKRAVWIVSVTPRKKIISFGNLKSTKYLLSEERIVARQKCLCNIFPHTRIMAANFQSFSCLIRHSLTQPNSQSQEQKKVPFPVMLLPSLSQPAPAKHFCACSALVQLSACVCAGLTGAEQEAGSIQLENKRIPFSHYQLYIVCFFQTQLDLLHSSLYSSFLKINQALAFNPHLVLQIFHWPEKLLNLDKDDNIQHCICLNSVTTGTFRNVWKSCVTSQHFHYH